MLTKQEITAAMPPQLKGSVTDDFVTMVNTAASDPETAKQIRDNFIGYTRVLLDGRFKSEDYLNAVTFVSYKLMGYTSKESYSRTFPQRYTVLISRGTSEKDIAAYVAAYARNKLVNMIMEQSLVPTWVLNQDVYQEAINTQAHLMMNAKSEKVRSDAANSILTHLKRPEKKEIELNLGVKENSGMNELKDLLTTLAEKQQQMIGSGTQTREIAHQKLIKNAVDAEVIPNEGSSDE